MKYILLAFTASGGRVSSKIVEVVEEALEGELARFTEETVGANQGEFVGCIEIVPPAPGVVAAIATIENAFSMFPIPSLHNADVMKLLAEYKRLVASGVQ